MKINNTYNLDFWKGYDWANVDHAPSFFAKFCMAWMQPGASVLDVCSGNGRDSAFFKSKGLSVTSFDHDTVNLLDKKSRFGFDKDFDYVYCRFVLHCIPEHLEDYVLINCHKILKENGLLFIEVRSDAGTIPERLNNHYRRLINREELKLKLERLNFDILYKTEANGLSVSHGEDPVLIRFVVRKNGEIVTRGTRMEEKRTYNPIHLQQSIYLLFTVKQVFEDYNIPFFLLFGTLLAAYREKYFIKHDTDIDLGLMDEYKEKVMWLINEGYFAIRGLKFTREWHGKEHLKALQYKQDYIDFWFWKKEGSFYASGRQYRMESFQIDKGLSTIMFYGQKFNTPNDIERYLDVHYNRGWKEPIEDYHASH